MKNCRYSGCPVEQDYRSCQGTFNGQCYGCLPDSIFFQTDFTCCAAKEDRYGGNSENIGVLGNDIEIATCDWEISLYRARSNNDNPSDPYTPVVSADGTAIKWGTAWGTCYLNSGADHCDHPLCERMAINVQGGLYTTCAYSPDLFVELAPPEELCLEGFVSPFQQLLREQSAQTPAAPPAPAAKEDTAAAQQISTANLASPCDAVANDILDGSFLYLGKKCWGSAQNRQSWAKSPAGQKAKLAAANNGQGEGFYSGLALVISGPMSTSSKKDLKVEENGLFELTLAYGSFDDTIVNPTSMWPVVRGRSAKLRFTREEDSERHY